MRLLVSNYLKQETPAHTLALYRILFGLLMCISIIRFWLKGWIEELYINPVFHFSYYGFEWINPLGNYTYLIFLICFIASLFVAIGLKYRISIIIFFLSFVYIECMDKTTYLNHYYFISILGFLLIFLPANAYFSIDNLINKKSYHFIPKWNVHSIKFLISIVYIYAAISKMNSDWLFEAMPLKIWMASKYDFPLLGETIFQKDWFYYFMSWSGMLYDLLIPFLLLYNRTRIIGFLLVIIFHALTKILFPIGMFPYIMIFSAIIFFPPQFHKRAISILYIGFSKISYYLNFVIKTHHVESYNFKYLKSTLLVLVIFFFFQLLIPFRYMLYPGELFWHEQGYRFSWRVMLVEKVGLASFKIVNSEDDSFFYVNNSDFLTPLQEKQMSFQPDLILEYAHYLGDYYSINNNVKVFVDNYVSLNGRKSQRLISDTVDLYLEQESFRHKKWILPLNDEIKGF